MSASLDMDYPVNGETKRQQIKSRSEPITAPTSRALRFIFNRTNVTGDTVQQQLGLSARTIFTSYTKNTSLGPPEGPFGAFGKTSGDIATWVIQNPGQPAFTNAFKDFAMQKVNTFNSLNPADRYNTIASSRSVGLGGHLGQVAAIQKFANAGDLIQSEALNKMTIDNMVPRVKYITPERAKLMYAAPNLLGYFLNNEDAIKSESDAYFAQGGSLKNCAAVLGDMGIVSFPDVTTISWGQYTYRHVMATTTRNHFLDGPHTWGNLYDADRPGEIMFMNFLSGKNPNILADVVNGFLQTSFLGGVWETASLQNEANMRNVPLSVVLADHQGLSLQRAIFDSLDAFYTLGQGARYILGPNVTEKLVVTAPNDGDTSVMLSKMTADGLATDTFPATTDPIAVVVADEPRYTSALVTGEDTSFASDSPMNPFDDVDRTTIVNEVNNTAMYVQGPDDIAGLRSTVVELTKAAMSTVTDPSRPTDEIYTNLCEDQSLASDIRGAVREAILDPVLDQIKDTMANNQALSAKFDPAMISESVNVIGVCQTVDAIVAEGGLAQIWAYDTIEPAVVTAVTGVDLATQLSKETSATLKAQGDVTSAQTKVNGMEPDDPELVEAEKELAAAQETLDEAQAQQDSTTELSDIQSDPVGRQNDRDQESNDQQRELFSPPEANIKTASVRIRSRWTPRPRRLRY